MTKWTIMTVMRPKEWRFPNAYETEGTGNHAFGVLFHLSFYAICICPERQLPGMKA